MIIDAMGLVTNPQGNRPQNPSSVIGIAIHHTVGYNGVQSETDERATIRAIDQQHVAAGYGGFGYHGIVFPSGRAYHCGEGQRAHVAKRNHELRGWTYSGTFTTEKPTAAAEEGMREVLLFENEQRKNAGLTYNWPIKGHREWALPGEGTACPGSIVPRDWQKFLYPNPRQWAWGNETAGCEIRGNQLFYWHRGVETDAVGDFEGNFPGEHWHNEGGNWVRYRP